MRSRFVSLVVNVIVVAASSLAFSACVNQAVARRPGNAEGYGAVKAQPQPFCHDPHHFNDPKCNCGNKQKRSPSCP